MTKIENSCGCVFCDLDLATKQAGLGGGYYHEISSTDKAGEKTTKFIHCPVKSQ